MFGLFLQQLSSISISQGSRGFPNEQVSSSSISITLPKQGRIWIKSTEFILYA